MTICYNEQCKIGQKGGICTEKRDAENLIRLLPKTRSRLLRLVFSRLAVILLLIITQIILIAAIYGMFQDFIERFKIIQTLFTISMVLYLFNEEMDSSAKLTWLWLIAMFPFPGSLLLWFTDNNFGNKRVRERINTLIEETKTALPQNETLLSDPALQESGTRDLCHYLSRSGCFPVYQNQAVTYYPSGESMFRSLIEELERAEKFIFMEFFIIAEGYMWGKVLSVLSEKARQGVDVRVMYDGMCEISSLSFDYPKRIESLGIRCKDFSPVQPFLSTHYNYRDHRKIIVIDGKTAYTGGVNLADEYINQQERFGHWKDAAVMIRGDAVRSFTLMFLQMWNITEHTPQWEPFISVEPECKPGSGWVIPFSDCPLDTDKVGENIYIDILSRARSYVHIMTPYLILDGELENALKFAAQRGVDVEIILPGIPDKKTAYALAKSHYRSLLDAGVKIYEYSPGFVHAKVVISDDEKAVVGTINFDYRSLYHHFECAAYLFRTDCIADIEQDFRQTRAECRTVTAVTVQNESLYYKLLGGFLKIFSPLM
ncbi:MAG: cardiolipin synthase [Oscillospiraceae bacterium]|nr:cardiolipin synthase [Oscillospiraceae bacterium]